MRSLALLRVDSDIVEKLVPRESNHESKLSQAQREDMTAVFNAQLPKGGKTNFYVSFENACAEAAPSSSLSRNRRVA